jgi:hypothetical protein
MPGRPFGFISVLAVQLDFVVPGGRLTSCAGKPHI